MLSKEKTSETIFREKFLIKYQETYSETKFQASFYETYKYRRTTIGLIGDLT